jgi:hypothetical protein
MNMMYVFLDLTDDEPAAERMRAVAKRAAGQPVSVCERLRLNVYICRLLRTFCRSRRSRIRRLFTRTNNLNVRRITQRV